MNFRCGGIGEVDAARKMNGCGKDNESRGRKKKN